MDGTFGEQKQNYNAYYAEQLREGLQYQDFIAEHLYQIGLPLFNYASKEYQCKHGENKLGVEIKYDKKMDETGNIYIEVAEKSHPNNPKYIDSGIKRNDNTWLYIIGNKKVAFVFTKRMLLLRENEYRHVETATSKGFLVPISDAEKYAAKILNFSKSLNK